MVARKRYGFKPIAGRCRLILTAEALGKVLNEFFYLSRLPLIVALIEVKGVLLAIEKIPDRFGDSLDLLWLDGHHQSMAPRGARPAILGHWLKSAAAIAHGPCQTSRRMSRRASP